MHSGLTATEIVDLDLQFFALGLQAGVLDVTGAFVQSGKPGIDTGCVFGAFQTGEDAKLLGFL